ncbi:MAG: hypothetical protein SGI74_00500 [Oligoflexia bacterium]|nr:hypothetical protein [Oligoflexia bacterium]
MKSLILVIAILSFVGCSSKSLTPDVREVKMSRENPDSECKELGRVSGTTMTAQGTSEEALADMQDDAAKKGANFVKIGQYSGSGTGVIGVAYDCP